MFWLFRLRRHIFTKLLTSVFSSSICRGRLFLRAKKSPLLYNHNKVQNWAKCFNSWFLSNTDNKNPVGETTDNIPSPFSYHLDHWWLMELWLGNQEIIILSFQAITFSFILDNIFYYLKKLAIKNFYIYPWISDD